MERNSYVVIGKYRDPAEIRATLDRLKSEGYAREDVMLHSNRRDVHDPFEDTMDLDTRAAEGMADVRADETTDRSFWEDFKDMFSSDDDRDVDATADDDYLAPYRDDIQNGYTVIAVRDYTGDVDVEMGMAKTDVEPMVEPVDTTVDHGLDVDTHEDRELTENEKIQLKEERLHVDKE